MAFPTNPMWIIRFFSWIYVERPPNTIHIPYEPAAYGEHPPIASEYKDKELKTQNIVTEKHIPSPELKTTTESKHSVFMERCSLTDFEIWFQLRSSHLWMRFLIWKERSNCQNTVHSPNEILFIFFEKQKHQWYNAMAKGWIGNKYTINLELYYSWIVTGYCKRSTTAELPDLDPKCQPGLRWHQGSQQDQLCFQKHRKLRFWSKQSDTVGPSMRLMNDDNKHQWDMRPAMYINLHYLIK